MQQRERRLARHPPVSIGGSRTHPFEQAQHGPDSRDGVQRGDERHFRRTGIGKANLGASGARGEEQTFGAVRRSIGAGRVRGESGGIGSFQSACPDETRSGAPAPRSMEVMLIPHFEIVNSSIRGKFTIYNDFNLFFRDFYLWQSRLEDGRAGCGGRMDEARRARLPPAPSTLGLCAAQATRHHARRRMPGR
jgi:hypothetical protein